MRMLARPIAAVLEREVLKLARERGRLLSSFVRPLLWLLVIGAGLGAATDADYQAYLVPGVLGMTLLFGAVLSALSTVYDKESGVMRMLVIAPIAHHWIVLAKVLAATLAAVLQALVLLVLLALLGFLTAGLSIALLVVGVLGTAFACASLGMLMAAWSRTLENYATVMNFVIFPVFFLSGALYPVHELPVVLRAVAVVNPFTYGVDLLKHAGVSAAAAAYAADFDPVLDLAVLAGFSAAALFVASLRFASDRGQEPLIRRLV